MYRKQQQHPFNGPFSSTTWVSRYQKGKTSLDLNQARDDWVLECSGISWISLQCFDTVGWAQEGHPACKKTKWWGAGVVICLEQGADLHMVQLIPLPCTVSCSSKIQTMDEHL